MNKITKALLAVCILALAGCGGGGGGSSNSSSGGNNNPTNPTNPVTPTLGNNQTTITVGKGISTVVNQPTVSVTICVPGTSTCQTVPDVLVDTGSSGLRIASAALPASFITSLTNLTASGQPVGECMQFVNSYSWGSVKNADVKLAGEVASDISVQIIGDNSAGLVPTACSSTSPNAQNDPTTLGVNGIIGISTFAQDCGAGCAQVASNTFYYACPNGACVGTKLQVADQVANPISQFAQDNNGSVIAMNSVPDAGATSVSGTLTFGVDTQSNNIIPGTFYAVDPSTGNVPATYKSQNVTSFFDTGSTAYFLSDSSLPACGSNFSGFFCPTSETQLTATVTGENGSNGTVNFSIGNAQNLINANPTFFAFDNLGVSSGSVTNLNQTLDFGIPFYFGKTVATVIENGTTTKGTGPGVAF